MENSDPMSYNSMDDVIAVYMKDVDMSIIEANLRLTVEERLIKLTNHVNFVLELRRAYKASVRPRDLEMLAQLEKLQKAPDKP